MTSDLEVDADAVRACAADLADTAAELGAGAAPPSAGPPRWQTTAAAADLADRTQRVLAGLAGELEEFRRAVLTTLDDYEAADRRAADRLGRAG